MYDTKDNATSLPIKEMPLEKMAVKLMAKQHYQRDKTGSIKGSWHKRLKEDFIAIEEPLQISLSYYNSEIEQYQTKVLTITMRTPGNDLALIHGFLLCEGIINNKSDITAVEFDPEQQQGNAACVVLAQHVQPNWQAIERQFTSHSSCGICGKTSLNALQLKAPEITCELNTESNVKSSENSTSVISINDIFQLPSKLRQHQGLFSQTGAMHAAGLYCSGEFLAIAEDIGRHNAVDKVVGMNCLGSTSLNAETLTTIKTPILVLSGRISFELIQKAIMANIQIIVAVGAPSALTISAAKQFNVTLIGFTKTDSFNVYHGDWRVDNSS